MSLLVNNPFVTAETAKAYARGRPYFHPLVMERVKATLGLRAPLELAVDVACGAGMSSLALLAVADRVVATDISPEMLSQAPADGRIDYRLAPADALPLGDEQADLMTVSSAFHWFEREAFLQEARRVLRPGGWLAVYENYFESRHPNPALEEWLKTYYRTHPSPPRDRTPFTNEDAQKAGFDSTKRLTYENTWTFTPPAFVSYLLSQSNAVAAVERGLYTLADLERKLTGQLEPFLPFFTSGEEMFFFNGFIWLLRRT